MGRSPEALEGPIERMRGFLHVIIMMQGTRGDLGASEYLQQAVLFKAHEVAWMEE